MAQTTVPSPFLFSRARLRRLGQRAERAQRHLRDAQRQGDDVYLRRPRPAHPRERPERPPAGESGTTWLYTYDCGGNILSKSYYRYTTGTPGAHDTILYSYTDNNWKDKLTAYDGQTITYDAIGNPLNDGRRRYEWQAGRQLKKVYVKADLREGTKAGVDEQSGTVLKIAWSD